MSKKRDKKWSVPPIEYPHYEVIEITEGKKTWYEVHSGMTKIVGGWLEGRYRSEAQARRVAEKHNRESDERNSRTERSLG